MSIQATAGRVATASEASVIEPTGSLHSLQHLLRPSEKISFADVAHQTLIFDASEPSEALVLELIDTRWMQRLRSIGQTGNAKLVYMFAEHSRFGHSLGVAYLATQLMKQLRANFPEQIHPYQSAVAAAAILHDVGHVAPGSHLAERIWAPQFPGQHEQVSIRVIQNDPQILEILRRHDPKLPELIGQILGEDSALPPWTSAIISGGGWNADRGNWAIVDSAMCAVSYGKYNVLALVDAYRLSPDGRLILQESRLDALTNFFVARDSMYRQVYQHRVVQAVDALLGKIVLRLRDLVSDSDPSTAATILGNLGIFCDNAMLSVILSPNYAMDLALETIFQMTEPWWHYHLERWCTSNDPVLADLCSRIRDRRLFKTIRLKSPEATSLVEQVSEQADSLGFDPRYYVMVVDEADAHRGKAEEPPLVLLDDGRIVPVTEVEPLIAQILMRPQSKRRWIAVPKKVKEVLGYHR